jgi:hypothetical protein
MTDFPKPECAFVERVSPRENQVSGYLPGSVRVKTPITLLQF